MADFKCDGCGYEHEDPVNVKNQTCPLCKGKMRRLFSKPSIKFNGAGFYVNDYKKHNGSTEHDKTTSYMDIRRDA